MDVGQFALEFSTGQYLLLLFGSFLATLIGSLLGIGGGFIILGILSVLLPVTILIPVLAAVLACIDLCRAAVFRFHIDTSILRPFIVGSILGVTGGTLLFLSLSENVIGTGLAILILLSLAVPTSGIGFNISYPFFWVGTIHSFLSTMFGFGGLFQAVMQRTALGNLNITATLAMSFLVLELLKVSSYTLNGFDYSPYLGVIFTAACGAIPGAFIGRKLATRVSRKLYRSVQKVIIAAIAINILVRVTML